MAVKNTIQGENLHLFIKEGNTYKSVALCISANFDFQAEEESKILTKDHGNFSETAIKEISYSINSEHLTSVEEYDRLMELFLNKTELHFLFGQQKETETVASSNTIQHYTPKNGSLYKGRCIITSLNLQTSAGEKSRYSVVFKGLGAIKRVNAPDA